MRSLIRAINAGTTFIPLWEKAPIASLGDLAVALSDPNLIWAGPGEEQRVLVPAKR